MNDNSDLRTWGLVAYKVSSIFALRAVSVAPASTGAAGFLLACSGLAGAVGDVIGELIEIEKAEARDEAKP